jgi:hypothetical protein
MNAAPSGPGNAAVEPNAEDLDSVLGRFQDWANACHEQPISKHGSTPGRGRAATPKKANLALGARDASYEQALRASSYRRTVSPETETSPLPQPQTPAPLPVETPESYLRASPQRPTVIPVAAPPAPDFADLPTLTTDRKPHGAHAPFREVMRETAGLVSTPKTSAPGEIRSNALSLRVSGAEQARIRAGAAEANLSVSAYLRQCALSVDVLRDQVELALVELQKQGPKAAPPPGLAAIPGILGRFATRCFRHLYGDPSSTGISLR